MSSKRMLRQTARDSSLKLEALGVCRYERKACFWPLKIWLLKAEWLLKSVKQRTFLKKCPLGTSFAGVIPVLLHNVESENGKDTFADEI